jgi:glutaredoxin
MKLELYHFDSCPFCRRVRNHIEKRGIREQFTYYDILLDPAANARLLEINNDDDQVPCLVIDGKPMLESDDIIQWIDQNI